MIARVIILRNVPGVVVFGCGFTLPSYRWELFAPTARAFSLSCLKSQEVDPAMRSSSLIGSVILFGFSLLVSGGWSPSHHAVVERGPTSGGRGRTFRGCSDAALFPRDGAGILREGAGFLTDGAGFRWSGR